MASRLAGTNRQVSYKFWGEFEDDDITKLPQDYEAKVADDNRVYFIKYGTIIIALSDYTPKVTHFCPLLSLYLPPTAMPRKKHSGRTQSMAFVTK